MSLKAQIKAANDERIATRLHERLGLACIPEYRFDAERRWRFDFAFPLLRIALEVEGGAWTRGRHTRPMGFLKDMEKYNTYTLLGIYLLRFTTAQIEKEPAKCVDFIKKCFI